MSRFLTQKLSWNRFTSPPHHSFRWRGIDGSEVLTHFPPADTYTGAATIEELRYHAANYKDADRSSEGLYLFGYGDGGGGADAGMIERLRRSADLQGVPRATIRDPEAFFDRLAAATPDLAIIEGELYFEYHRGVYTSQAEVKRLNRLCETRLQALEFLAVASRLAGCAAPTASEIEALWRTVLTNQFHDILPGTSIAEVYLHTRAELANVAEAAKRMADELLGRLTGGDGVKTPINTLGFARAEVAKTPDGGLAYVIAVPFAAGKMVDPPDEARLVEDAGSVRLENGQLSAVLNADGLLCSLVHIETGREALAGLGGRILLLEDRPTAFDAWDIDLRSGDCARRRASTGLGGGLARPAAG